MVIMGLSRYQFTLSISFRKGVLLVESFIQIGIDMQDISFKPCQPNALCVLPVTMQHELLASYLLLHPG